MHAVVARAVADARQITRDPHGTLAGSSAAWHIHMFAWEGVEGGGKGGTEGSSSSAPGTGRYGRVRVLYATFISCQKKFNT